MVAPMCQYSALDGAANDWHLFHWANLFNSGAGCVILEATGVSPEARITPKCLGLWDSATEAALADKLSRARALAPSTPVLIQLAHAGRKASSALPWEGGQLLDLAQGGWQTVAPSAIPQLPTERTLPHALSEKEIAALIRSFVDSAKRAARIGVDGIELHGAHGYLLHEFLSPISNQRSDNYGGSFDNRVRLLLEVFEAVRAETPPGLVLGVRLSATDWVPGGWTAEETVELSGRLKARGCDYVHVSSGGISPQQKIALGPGYQLAFAKQVKAAQPSLATIAVGLITDPHQAESVVSSGDADLVALARAFLYNPRWGWHAAAALGGQVEASPPYWRCPPSEARAIFGPTKLGQR